PPSFSIICTAFASSARPATARSSSPSSTPAPTVSRCRAMRSSRRIAGRHVPKSGHGVQGKRPRPVCPASVSPAMPPAPGTSDARRGSASHPGEPDKAEGEGGRGQYGDRPLRCPGAGLLVRASSETREGIVSPRLLLLLQFDGLALLV